MAGGKLNARQKMINLMYLVFIAMMALNIDREVLRSFHNIDDSLVKTNALSAQNNKSFMGVIRARAEKNPDYVETEKKAQSVLDYGQGLISYLGGLKNQLSGEGGALDENGEINYKVLSNMEGVTNLFFVNDSKPTPTGDELVKKLEDFNKYVSSPDINKANFAIDIKPGKNETWLHKTFYSQPQVAAVTTLTKLQNDVYNAETEIIRSFLTTKMLDDLEINTFKGVISSPGIIQKGKASSAFVALGAFDNGINGTATVNGQTYQVVNGKATVPVSAGTPGDYTLSGSMSFTDAKGNRQTVPLDPVPYKVVDEVIMKQLPFTGVITADKMNVLYVGVDNPLSSTVSGVQPSTISLSGPGVRSLGNGKGTIRPSSVGNITLTVSGKTSEGKPVSKQQVFRVKGLPRPEAVSRGRSVLSVPASSLSRLSIDARMPSDFGFDISVRVTGFTVKVPGKPSQTISGNSLESASSVKSAKPGTTVTVFDIKTAASGGAPVPSASNNVLIEVL